MRDSPMTESQRADQLPLPGGNFRLFITRLSYQGLMSLGMLENPVTGTKAVILENARMIIDDLLMLKDKTSGNLDPDEYEHVDKLIGDLERAYAQIEEAAAQ
ncbi:MAG TPA: DUF1844 domain-containing protein [Planctomycetes bacterium]|nr:DUF1844 domain-containing protein [Planctomycetota bacterium]